VLQSDVRWKPVAADTMAAIAVEKAATESSAGTAGWQSTEPEQARALAIPKPVVKSASPTSATGAALLSVHCGGLSSGGDEGPLTAEKEQLVAKDAETQSREQKMTFGGLALRLAATGTRSFPSRIGHT
jgi:hypothetical protein